MAFGNRLIMGIAIACSLVLANCAFPVRPGYDRKSGSYKRYRVPKKEIVEADTTTVNAQEELVQEEILAAASKNTGKLQMNATDSTDTSVQDSTVSNTPLQTGNVSSHDSSSNIASANNGAVREKQKQDSSQVRNSDTTKTAVNATAKATEKKTEKKR